MGCDGWTERERGECCTKESPLCGEKVEILVTTCVAMLRRMCCSVLAVLFVTARALCVRFIPVVIFVIQ